MKKLACPALLMLLGSCSNASSETAATAKRPFTALPIKMTGCESKTSFQLKNDADVIISTFVKGQMPAINNSRLEAVVTVDGRQCLMTQLNRNSHVHGGTVSGSCSMIARRGQEVYVELKTARIKSARCFTGEVNINFRTPDLYGALVATSGGFTTVQSMREIEVNLSGSVKAGKYKKAKQGYMAAEVIVDGKECLTLPPKPVSNAGTSSVIGCNRLLKEGAIQKYSVQIKPSNADPMVAQFKLAPT